MTELMSRDQGDERHLHICLVQALQQDTVVCGRAVTISEVSVNGFLQHSQEEHGGCRLFAIVHQDSQGFLGIVRFLLPIRAWIADDTQGRACSLSAAVLE